MSHDPTLAWLDADALTHAYRARTLSPPEVVRACLAAIEARNPALNAFLVIDGERAMAAARASGQRWMSGTPRGCLDGIPVTVKDLCSTRGLPARSGSLTTADVPGIEDAPAVARLAEDGALPGVRRFAVPFRMRRWRDSPRMQQAYLRIAVPS